ncbi:MAG TPA: hypothetical protein DEF41_04350 [Desulfovibrio sp.]|uniref:Uncharacterized protein n=1 Tax=Nitratidesulfovibrio vulgaris (strain ATCC 29579 / DSM 644 / CCUG 34227 / NCIMB 8303 / VKM B-1760 / Hildenborough) TaxID=882 RepID=Q72B73_NITV2|nr:hypothetical protein DVU_1763 [Nitratidesulfovibrio vulgaris str. Hildenborough]HBW15367.1 hypothetical protein [Desulfovibrio sp.]
MRTPGNVPLEPGLCSAGFLHECEELVSGTGRYGTVLPEKQEGVRMDGAVME